ncbi:MAG: ABC transporter substrate-binding protein [Chitinophagaceae bacterium]
MKKQKLVLFFLFSMIQMIHAQTITSTVLESNRFEYPSPIKKESYNVAVLSPMYLDSTDWTKNVANLPRFMQAGIDFYQGVRIAADTLNNEGVKINLYIFDSKSSYFDVQQLIASDRLDSMDLIIGNASTSDLDLIASFAKQKKINFVSAVSPSDAGQSNNPYFTILQPRLSTHIEKIHKDIQRHYPENNVLYIHTNSQPEKNGLAYFKEDILTPLPTRFSEYELKGDNIDWNVINKFVDSTYATTIVLGTLDANLTYKLLKDLQAHAKSLRLKVYCMPTAEAIKALKSTEEFPDLSIYYTTSYIIDKITPASMYIQRQYKNYMGGNPPDVVYKGFESIYFFTHLMKRYGVPFNEKFKDNSFTFITPYKIVAVKEKNNYMFYENKFLYLVRYENGIMTYE